MMKIEESNKLIAEFMGAKLGEYYISGTPKEKWLEATYQNPITVGQRISYEQEQYYIEEFDVTQIKVEELKYHTSWDWLMPVVKKIDEEMPCQLPEELNDFSDAFHFGLYEADITKVYSAVIQFIHFYNKTK